MTMIGWEAEYDRRKLRRNLLLILICICIAAGFIAGWYAGTHRCPQEDSCTYNNHQWVPTEH